MEIDPPRNRRLCHKIGLRGLWPFDIVNVDVTILRLLNNQKVYIYLIMDNFSRCILGWKASLDKLDKDVAIQNLLEVWEKYFKGNPNLKPTRWISDGGPENINHAIMAELKKRAGDVVAMVAQKDIRESNSMIEYLNRIAKYRYLYHYDIPDFQASLRHIEKFVDLNNNVIPQRVLRGHTPTEYLTGDCQFTIRSEDNVRETKQARILTNKAHRCKICPA